MVRGFLRSRPIQFLVFLVSVCLLGTALAAQNQEQDPLSEPAPDHQHPTPNAVNAGWSWTADGNVIAGYNYQERRFADFWALESQNWFMLHGDRTVGSGRLTVHGMVSLEPFTIDKFLFAGRTRIVNPVGGSPQAFQTGESFQGAPLINFQHPHDLLMGLGATYRVGRGRVKYIVGADLVGSPALGPTAFMHRESARDNPQVPLTHHYLDSTHITPGVVRAGVELGSMTFETSAFRGEEPDDDRLNIERPRIDSWSGRAGWHRGPWQAQFSGGHLHEPEWFEPVDVVRLTASIAYDGAVRSRPLAATVAWGQNREPSLGFALDGYLADWDLKVTGTSTVYGRAESVLKEIFGLGVHPRGLLNHPRRFSQINALTLGYVHDLPLDGWSRIGIGADITVHRTSAELIEFYGLPHSYHVFLRWRPARASSQHVH
jgi:hypothetical protein